MPHARQPDLPRRAGVPPATTWSVQPEQSLAFFAVLRHGERLDGDHAPAFLTNESAVVQLLGGDNRLTAVVIGGISLAVAAALCTIVTEPAAAPNSSHSQGSVGKPTESSV